MSHFSVLVCLPGDTDLETLEDRLGEVMAPWDENVSVKAYRSYEDGAPSDFWWVGAMRRGAEHHANGTGLTEEDRRSVFAGRAPKTVEEKRAEYADDNAWSEKLGEAPSWELVVQLYNQAFHPGNELATTDDDSDSDRLYYEVETARAYKMSTYNPESKWDYWRIGGRWGGYFVAKQQAPGLIRGGRSWDSPKGLQPGIRCDGGPISLLSFDLMRDEAGAKANARYDKWEAICATTPAAQPWSHFRGLAELKEITWDQAREQYRTQPRITATNQDEELRWLDCPVEEFLTTREEYEAEARRGAVPGYALVTLKGEWVAPGRMGWFGMSSEGAGERSGYRIAVNTYLDELDPSTLVVVLDCHI